MNGTKGLYSHRSCCNVNIVISCTFGFVRIQTCSASSRSYMYSCANIGCMLGSCNKTLHLLVNLPWTRKQ